MPNVYVFPGGRVDRQDARAPTASELRDGVAARLRETCSPARARALAVAAVRETFEETGLRFGPLHQGALLPNLDRLEYIARAITPSVSPVRYHARFFVARADGAEGELRGSGELLDLRFVPLEEALTLRVIDVTAFVLEHLREILGGSQPKGLPLYHYKSSKGRVRWDALRSQLDHSLIS